MTATSTAVELVQSLFEAFGRGDIGYILERVAPDCRWVAPGKAIPNAGVFTGPAGVQQFFERLAASEQVTSFEPREFLSNGDTVVALGAESCRTLTAGKDAKTNWAMVFRVREGKLTGYESYYDTEAYALAHQK